MKWQANSATRVDLGGGTLDCWPLFALVGGAETTNLSLSIKTSVDLIQREDDQIHMKIEDLSFSRVYSDLQSAIDDSEPAMALVRAHLRYWRPHGGFELRTRSESPVGGGLGGSSSLCISLIKVFSEMVGKKFSTYEMVELAHNLEAEVLNKPTGTQDYFPAVEPGLNIIHYQMEGIRLEKIKVPIEVFSKKMLLVYTGQPHHSGLNNWQVIKAAVEGHKPTMAALHEIKRVAQLTAQACREHDWGVLPDLFQQEFKARVELSSGFTSDKIEKLRTVALGAGAEAVKICGAGGGGCVLVWTPPPKKGLVLEACQNAGFQVLDAAPVG